MAKRTSTAEVVPLPPVAEAAPPESATATPVPAAATGQGPDEPKAARLPDVRELKSVNFGPDRDSPRLRLLRSYRFNQIQIRADEELSAAAREQLKEAGWTERPEEGIWTKQLPRRPREGAGEEPKPVWPTVVEAEHLFQVLATAIRTEKGLVPSAPERGAGTPF
jgi:hypothetical protein